MQYLARSAVLRRDAKRPCLPAGRLAHMTSQTIAYALWRKKIRTTLLLYIIIIIAIIQLFIAIF